MTPVKLQNFRADNRASIVVKCKKIRKESIIAGKVVWAMFFLIYTKSRLFF